MSNLVANEMFPPVDASGMQAAEAEKEALDALENMRIMRLLKSAM